jgi:L-phenylalanine/L-methionine N-acetyltransferase
MPAKAGIQRLPFRCNKQKALGSISRIARPVPGSSPGQALSLSKGWDDGGAGIGPNPVPFGISCPPRASRIPPLRGFIQATVHNRKARASRYAARNPLHFGHAMIVRHSEPRDIESIRQIYAQSSVYADTLQLPFPSAELWQERLARRHEHFHSLVACEGDQVLGQVGIEVFANPRRRHVANIGMAVSELARRRGVGSALLGAAVELCNGWLGVRRIELETYTGNDAAIALFRKFGFEIEGTARAYALRAGAYADVHLMARYVALRG